MRRVGLAFFQATRYSYRPLCKLISDNKSSTWLGKNVRQLLHANRMVRSYLAIQGEIGGEEVPDAVKKAMS